MTILKLAFILLMNSILVEFGLISEEEVIPCCLKPKEENKIIVVELQAELLPPSTLFYAEAAYIRKLHPLP